MGDGEAGAAADGSGGNTTGRHGRATCAGGALGGRERELERVSWWLTVGRAGLGVHVKSIIIRWLTKTKGGATGP